MPASPAPTPSRALSPAKLPPASFPSTTNLRPTTCPTPMQRAPLLTTSPARFSTRSEEHTSELQSLMRISYAVFCLKKKTEQIEQKRIENTYNHTAIIQREYKAT